MRCPKCGGKGYYFVSEPWGEADILCEQCHGNGELDENGKPILTNEQWLKSLSTEELAEFLADKCNEVVDTVLSDASCNIDDADQDDYWYRKTDFVEWLKETHKDS